MTAKGIIDVYPCHHYYITIASFVKVYVHLPNHQNVLDAAKMPLTIVHNKDERYSYLPGVNENNSDSSISSVHYKSNHGRLEQTEEQEAIK